jgi:hypothetical protein
MGVWLNACGLSVASAQVSDADNRLLRAAFIYNFAKFTRWPEQALGEQDDPLMICTLGRDESVLGLERLGGKTIRGRSAVIKPIEGMPLAGACHVLYIARSEQERYRPIIAALGAEPVLTISELGSFGHSGGMIELYQEHDRIRFIINQRAAHKAGLHFNSRLLNLAVVIKDAGSSNSSGDSQTQHHGLLDE